MNRRDFLGSSTLLGASWLLGRDVELEEASVAQLQGLLRRGRCSSVELVEGYLRRIRRLDVDGPALRSVIELNPDAIAIARALDRERRSQGARGSLHGIPVLLKDNIDTGDRMMTTAGSLALSGPGAPADASLVKRLRAAGCVVLGKTNLSEWANFRGSRSTSGWSARGGQTRNPYYTDHGPSGSSSGSAVAVSASLCTVAVGTETDGSIVSPASYCGVVGLKPTVGLVSRQGVIPISSSQDTAGPMGRCVADVAALLEAMVGEDPLDEATRGVDARGRSYVAGLDVDGLRGMRVGVLREDFQVHRLADPVFESALVSLRQAGASLVDPVALPPWDGVAAAEFQVLLHEFKVGLDAYLVGRGVGAKVRSLADLIGFNERERDREMHWFGQETLVLAQATTGLLAAAYREARARCDRWRTDLGALLERERLAALVVPTAGLADVLDPVNGDHGHGGSSSYAAVAGFPSITVPCGVVRGLPIGLSFIGPAWGEGLLLRLAYAFEQSTRARQVPRFVPRMRSP